MLEKKMFGEYPIPQSCVFYETERTFAFPTHKPIVPGHVLVSPRRVVERLGDLSDDEVSDLFVAVKRVAKCVESVYGGTSITVGVQDGKEAGQKVFHVHVHVLPRWSGDFEPNEKIYSELASEKFRLDTEAHPVKTAEEMAEETVPLRNYFSGESKDQ
ncbi:MAG: bis(5'-adenosyl)-triphosphatase [Amphiamblys sp. WSBS2006]|nr:MAG: bis(5'-adenosyl)-triphosphatase [Amphiamblys sp. WSBS2006]